MMPSSSAAYRKSAVSGDGNVSDQFPAGLRVLVVDDDATCLKILEKMLRMCKYEVTKCNRAEVALSLLRENKNGFDVVISDVHMPDMDGFKLLVHIGLEMDLPVIMMSADDSKSVVMKGVTHGACDYLIKPVRIEALRNIWQHVVRKRKHEWKDLEQSASLDDGHNCRNANEKQKQPEDPDYSSSPNEGHNGKNTKRRKDDEDEAEEIDDSSSVKKPRVVWSHELHQQFVAAVNQLGIDKAVPKKILELMNVPGLTRENVASHLQKFRLYLRRLSGSQQSYGINASFMGNLDTSYGPIRERDFQALSANCELSELPAESLATLQAMILGRSSNLKSDISVDQRNTFSFENPKLRYEQVQNQPGNNSNVSKQMNLLHGIPTTMDPRQLMGLQSSFTGMSGQGFTPNNGQSQSHASIQGILPNGMADNMRQPVLTNRFVPRYGLSNNVNQSKRHDWGLQAVNMTFHPSQHTNNLQGGTNVQQNCPSGQKIEGGTHVAENLSRDKDENIDYGTSHQQFCSEEHTQDDLLTAILSQQLQQEAIGQGEHEFAFDWYSLDNLPA